MKWWCLRSDWRAGLGWALCWSTWFCECAGSKWSEDVVDHDPGPWSQIPICYCCVRKRKKEASSWHGTGRTRRDWEWLEVVYSVTTLLSTQHKAYIANPWRAEDAGAGQTGSPGLKRWYPSSSCSNICFESHFTIVNFVYATYFFRRTFYLKYSFLRNYWLCHSLVLMDTCIVFLILLVHSVYIHDQKPPYTSTAATAWPHGVCLRSSARSCSWPITLLIYTGTEELDKIEASS